MSVKNKQIINSEDEIVDLVRGLTFFGTGGGGKPEDGIRALKECIYENLEISWVCPNDIPSDSWACVVFGMGSIAPSKIINESPFGPVQRKIDLPMVEAVKELEAFSGVKVEVIVPFELGGSNTPRAMSAGYHLGARVPDGDLCGRAVPELTQTLAALSNIPVLPVVIVDNWGNVIILKDASNFSTIEGIGKALSVISKSSDPSATCAHAAHLVRFGELRSSIVKKSISRSMELGKTIRETREKGEDPIKAVCISTGGRLLFRGNVVEKKWKNKKGYMEGSMKIVGVKEFQSRNFSIWFKNENHMAWEDAKPVCMSPDIISVVSEKEGEPITNTLVAEGQGVCVIGVPNILYRNQKGIEVLGPSHFGFSEEYIPFE